MLEFEPTDQQKNILAWNGNAVIVAGPGSGKTWTLAKKVQDIMGKCRNYQGVAAISYTNKASKELERRAKLLCNGTKQSFFGTIDSFCIAEIVLPFGKRIMGTPSVQVLVENTQIPSQLELIKSIKKAILTIIEKYSEHTLQQIYDQNISPYNELDLSYRVYLKERFLGGGFDLHLINEIANLIIMSSKTCSNYLKAKYRYVLIDEFQDSGFLQYSLFKRFSELGINSWAVGDFNQSIYSFKSGSPEYMEALISMESFQRFDMNINHRCHPYIQAYAELFLKIQNEEEICLIPEGNSRIIRVSLEGTQSVIGEWINVSLNKIIERTGFKKSLEIAVLARTNESLEMISELLKVPHRIKYKLLLDDDRSIGGNLLRQLLTLTFNPKEHTTKDFVEYYFDTRIRGVRENISSVKKLISKFKDACQDERKECKRVDSVINIVNQIIRSIYPEYELNKFTKEAIKQLVDNSILFENFRPVKNDEIQLLTIHGSKGLEFDIVLHVDLYEDIFPNYLSTGNAIKEQEDVNLHYIALTRAREYVYLISTSIKRIYSKRYGRYYEHPKNPSPYIQGDIKRYQLLLQQAE